MFPQHVYLLKVLFCFSEPKQDDCHDPVFESVHTVPSARSTSRFEANEYGPDAWEGSSANPSLLDVVCDDSNIVTGNTVREIALMCFHILATNVVSRRVTIHWQPKLFELN